MGKSSGPINNIPDHQLCPIKASCQTPTLVCCSGSRPDRNPGTGRGISLHFAGTPGAFSQRSCACGLVVQVFVNISGKLPATRRIGILSDIDIISVRNPSYDPSCVSVLRGRDVPHLRQYRNIIFFSVKARSSTLSLWRNGSTIGCHTRFWRAAASRSTPPPFSLVHNMTLPCPGEQGRRTRWSTSSIARERAVGGKHAPCRHRTNAHVLPG